MKSHSYERVCLIEALAEKLGSGNLCDSELAALKRNTLNLTAKLRYYYAKRDELNRQIRIAQINMDVAKEFELLALLKILESEND